MRLLKKYWPIIIVATIFVYLIFNNIFQCIRENNESYNFTISKVEVTPTRSLVLYNNDKKIELWNFIISENEKVKIGDLIYKEKCSPLLLIKRKNSIGEYEVYSKVNFSGIIPFEFLCK